MRAIDRAKDSKGPSAIWGILKCAIVLVVLVAVYIGLDMTGLLPSITGPVKDFIGRILP